VHVGEERSEKIKLSVISYDEVNFQEQEVDAVEKAVAFRKKGSVMWLNVDGVHKPEIIEQVGRSFGVHPLVLEDIADTGQRPKMEDFDDYIFVTLKMFRFGKKEKEIKTEQISLVLGNGFVVSFQEAEGDVFDPIRERLRNNKGRVRKAGADYLVYALMDAVVDNYFLIMEKLGETIEEIEDKLVINPTSETVQKIHGLKRQLIFLRKSVWPLREVISRLERSESPLILKSTFVYLRDVYDHTIQVMDSVDTFRDTLSGMLDIYLSKRKQSNERSNEGLNCHRHNIHSFNLHSRDLRHELQGHARAWPGMGVPDDLAFDACNRACDGDLFQKKEVDIAGLKALDIYAL
jgi:magnesium transporter